MNFFFNHFKIFYIIILYLIVSKTNSTTEFIYPSAISLSNNKILVIDKFGINIYDSNLEFVRNVYTFPDEEQIKDEEALSRVLLKIYSEYIFSIINDKIHIFKNSGELIFRSSSKIINGQYPEYYTLAPGPKYATYFYYVIGFFDKDVHLNLISYKLNMETKENIFVSSIKNEYYTERRYYSYSRKDFYDEYYFLNWGLSCEYMYDSEKN